MNYCKSSCFLFSNANVCVKANFKWILNKKELPKCAKYLNNPLIDGSNKLKAFKELRIRIVGKSGCFRKWGNTVKLIWWSMLCSSTQCLLARSWLVGVRVLKVWLVNSFRLRVPLGKKKFTPISWEKLLVFKVFQRPRN